MPAKIVELRPLKETTEDFERIERELQELWKREIYLPLIRELGFTATAIKNSRAGLLDAIRTGRVSFSKGEFSGRLSASISKDLRAIGAALDPRTKTFKIHQRLLPTDVLHAVQASEIRFDEKMSSIDKRLAQIVPAEIAGKVKIAKFFDASLWKTEKDFQASVRGITVAPKLSKEVRARISEEWQNNMKLWVKDFTQKETVKLRQDMRQVIMSGGRYESAVKTIQASYGVSSNKARFLARQESSLLLTKFKEARYSEAGVTEYRWGCVAGSKNHPVRPWHKALEGKTFKFTEPPVTTKPGEPVRHNNPGEDYNCRCFARPIVRF